MHFLAQFSAKLVFCAGLMMTVVSWVIGSAIGMGTGGIPLIGVLLMATGAFLWHRASTRACSSCFRRVKLQARSCQHCGAALAG